VEEVGADVLEENDMDGTIIEEVDCGNKVCKVTFLHDKREEKRKFYERISNQGPWSGNHVGESEEMEDETWQSYIYFVRKGERLPMEDMAKIFEGGMEME
jgi:hypothetical protein